MVKKKKPVLAKAKKKTSIARAVVGKGSGHMRVNKKAIDTISPAIARDEIMIPVLLAQGVLGQGFESELSIDVNVKGGGYMSQAEASKAAIAKALVEFTGSDKLKDTYIEYDRSLVVDDVRRKESKKAMRLGARAKYQKSYR